MPDFDIAPDEAWTAVVTRDRRFDGEFVYAVTSTGIFCRPSCPSRKPLRKNVLFFGTPGAATKAGFRACLRCRPERDGATATERAVRAARAYVDAHINETVTLERLSAEAGLSPYHLQRSFKRIVGLSPKDYQTARRLEVFKHEVGRDKSVLEAAFEAGFASSSSLYEKSEAALGMTPGTYRQGGKDMAIRYATLPSAFGRILIAATPRGVCAVSLGDDDAELVSELHDEFPQAAIIERDDAVIRDWAKPVVRYLDGGREQPILTLDLRGTDFQRSVWTALQRIPIGETRTYGELAEMLGRPGAARAVARACAGNRIAVLVPCHRIIRNDGSISGYRWGVERKQRLLEHEKGSSNTG